MRNISRPAGQMPNNNRRQSRMANQCIKYKPNSHNCHRNDSRKSDIYVALGGVPAQRYPMLAWVPLLLLLFFWWSVPPRGPPEPQPPPPSGEGFLIKLMAVPYPVPTIARIPCGQCRSTSWNSAPLPPPVGDFWPFFPPFYAIFWPLSDRYLALAFGLFGYDPHAHLTLPLLGEHWCSQFCVDALWV